MSLANHSRTIEQVCHLLSQNRLDEAGLQITREYPFLPKTRVKRSYTPREMIAVFLKWKFQDCYRGTRLVFPPVLRLLSLRLPTTFPYHKNGKMDEGHIAYWELFPTIDHLEPIATGGHDAESNWVCCSMLTNSIKANWTLDQLGWAVKTDLDPNWDGLLSWFLLQYKKDPELGKIPYMKTWFLAAVDVLAGSA